MFTEQVNKCCLMLIFPFRTDSGCFSLFSSLNLKDNKRISIILEKKEDKIFIYDFTELFILLTFLYFYLILLIADYY